MERGMMLTVAHKFKIEVHCDIATHGIGCQTRSTFEGNHAASCRSKARIAGWLVSSQYPLLCICPEHRKTATVLQRREAIRKVVLKESTDGK